MPQREGHGQFPERTIGTSYYLSHSLLGMEAISTVPQMWVCFCQKKTSAGFLCGRLLACMESRFGFQHDWVGGGELCLCADPCSVAWAGPCVSILIVRALQSS